MNKGPSTKVRIATIFGTFFTLMLVSTLTGLAWLPPPVQAGPTVPPREPSDEDEGGDGDDQEPFGAYIELHGGPAGSGLWAIVQWQDSAGQWHDVEGWRGTLDASGNRRWWVAAKDFGTGPFRWAIYQAQGSELLAASNPFYLPHAAGETIATMVPLGP